MLYFGLLFCFVLFLLVAMGPKANLSAAIEKIFYYMFISLSQTIYEICLFNSNKMEDMQM